MLSIRKVNSIPFRTNTNWFGMCIEGSFEILFPQERNKDDLKEYQKFNCATQQHNKSRFHWCGDISLYCYVCQYAYMSTSTKI